MNRRPDLAAAALKAEAELDAQHGDPPLGASGARALEEEMER